jgi:hypothetical protein
MGHYEIGRKTRPAETTMASPDSRRTEAPRRSDAGKPILREGHRVQDAATLGPTARSLRSSQPAGPVGSPPGLDGSRLRSGLYMPVASTK